MPDSDRSWELKSAADVAEALDWLRRRMKGKGLVLVAIGANAVAYSKDAKLAPEDAADLMEKQIGTVRQGLYKIQSQRVTRGTSKREDV